MTDPNYTALLLVIDRSGSMSHIRAEMTQALDQLVYDQAVDIDAGLLTVDLVQFDDEVEYLAKLADPRHLTIEIEPRGRTALYDAVAFAIDEFGAALDALPEHARPSDVQVVIVTDGFENASRRATAADVRRRVAHQEERYDWEFTFLGANQDAVLTGADIGIRPDSSLTFGTNRDQIERSRQAASRKIAEMRQTGMRSGFTQTERDESA